MKNNQFPIKYLIVIVGGCLISMIGFGIRGSIGLFVEPISMGGGPNAAVLSLTFAVQNLIWGMFQPMAGGCADKAGVIRTLLVGTLIYALGLVLMTAGDSAWLFYLSGGILMGLGISFSSFVIVLSAFAKILPKSMNSIAFGFGTAAGSAGQFLFAPIGQQLILKLGWMSALWIFGAAVMLIIPLSFTLYHKHSDNSGGLTDFKERSNSDSSLKNTLAWALGCQSYRLLTAGFFVCGFHVAFITVHLPAHISQVLPDSSLIGWSIALIGLFNIIGSLFSGYISSRIKKTICLYSIYFARAVVILLFITIPMSSITILVFASVMGILWLSTIPPTNGLVLIMFGPRYLATLFGIVLFSHQVGSFLGIYLGGLSFEYYGSFLPVWIAGIVLGIAAGLLHIPIKEQSFIPTSVRI